MKPYILIFICALFLFSCGTKLKVAEVRSLELKYNSEAPLNFGTSMYASIIATNNGGDEFDVTTNKKLSFTSPDVTKIGDQFIISKHPTGFDEKEVSYNLSLTDKEETFISDGKISLNFRGGLEIIANGMNGSDGEDQNDRGSRIILRDGKPGHDGTDGTRGGDGESYEAFIWKEVDLYYVYVHKMNSTDVWKYKTYADNTVLFNLMGGNGGNGGNGGDGGDGKDGKVVDGKSKNPGDGGTGGTGGNGGDGGNGGSLHLTVHSSAIDLSSKLKYNLSGGNGGIGGNGGKGGEAGEKLSGQVMANNGADGRSGSQGRPGADGISTIEFKDFDTSKYR